MGVNGKHKHTTIIELYGGPGCGKTEAAHRLCSKLKQAHVPVEMVPEYAKKWAYEQRSIDSLDEFYIFGKQTHAESSLLGKVDVVVTDRPVMLSAVYATMYAEHGISMAVAHATTRFYEEVATRGHRRIAIIVPRKHRYDHRGRFEDEEQAKLVDHVIEETIASWAGVGYFAWDGMYCGVSDDDLVAVMGDMLRLGA